ncbi:neuromodulin isoform X2 [Ambystoma mexicanum]|uniref:neuromodulin isoform X2 n=1 Tax=Ambystoma mexicanum TaxID=8296 RepID=UPI0037E816A8
MLCCMRRTKQVEKQDDADQKIEQDGNKPEDKAHKAATKIQASFRGHIIRKKMKGDMSDADIKANGEAVDNKEDAPQENQEKVTKAAASDTSATEEDKKQEDKPCLDKKPSEEKAGSDAAAPAENPPPSSTSAEKLDLGKTESTTEKGSNESLLTSSTTVAPATEEPKQADVPAASESKEDNTAKEEKSENAADCPEEQKKSDTSVTEQGRPKKSEAVEETKPTESAQQESDKGEEKKADQESA